MTFEKAAAGSGAEVKPVSGRPEAGRAVWAGAWVRPVLLRLVMPVGS